KIADENVSAPAPTRSDDQIFPFVTWVPIRKRNYVLDLHKKQKNPIFQISVDILQNTNFFGAFTASASVPAIYIQQFWNTLTYEAKAGAYSFQLDETRFVLDANLLREAFEITPIDQAHQFVSPPSGDGIMEFVNELGYTKVIHFVSRMAVNNLYQPWRAILSMINQCLTGKTSGHHRPKYPVLQMLWGIITSLKIYLGLDLQPSPVKQPKRGKVQKLRKGKPSLQLIDKDEPTQPEPEPEPEHQGKGEEYDVEHAIQMSLESFQAQSQAHVGGVAIRELVAEATRPLPVIEGKGKAIATDEQDDASTNIVHESPSLTDAETGADTDKTNSGGDTEILQIGEEQGDDVTNLVNLEEKTAEIDEGQVGSDPGQTPKSRPPPDDDKIDEDQAGPDPRESRMALAGPNPVGNYAFLT
ncbi:hypothetical protein Tco_1373426, partial [Tanacetum coccineum]